MIAKTLVVTVAIGTALATGALVAPAGAGATGKLHVTPDTGLTNREVVKVSGAGFKPKDTLYLLECQSSATSQAGCSSNTITTVTVSKTGSFPITKFEVRTGKIGTRACGTTTANAKSCVIDAGNASGGDTASAPIAFKLVRPKRS